jgi:hypothetical protein
MQMNSVLIGRDGRSLTIAELERCGPKPYDFGTYDVIVRNGAFSGQSNCYFTSKDFQDLRQALSRIYRDLSGTHRFEPIESQLVFSVTINIHGHVQVGGELFASAGDWDNSVKFSFQIDQTYLPEIVASLDKFLS